MTTGQLEKQSRFIKHGGARRNAGRKKGVPNKLTTALKETILEALDEAHEDGGKGYLIKVAQEQPAVFCGLLGKVLPMTVGGDQEHPLNTITTIRLVAGSSERSREQDS